MLAGDMPDVDVEARPHLVEHEQRLEYWSERRARAVPKPVKILHATTARTTRIAAYDLGPSGVSHVTRAHETLPAQSQMGGGVRPRGGSSCTSSCARTASSAGETAQRVGLGEMTL